MAISKSMDSPIKKSNYAAQVEQSQHQGATLSFLPVPGPQGDQGPRGDKGQQGDIGPRGERGEKGDPGKDGKSVLSPSEQMIGWGYYENISSRTKRTGIDQGDDGWISLSINTLGPNTNEKFLPKESVSLWNDTTKKLNFRTLNVGSIITIRYNLLLTTYVNNTEVWFKTMLADESTCPTTYVGNLKYQYDYEFSVQQTLFVNDQESQSFGGIPQIRTDNPGEITLKSIYVSVS